MKALAAAAALALVALVGADEYGANREQLAQVEITIPA